MCKVQYLCPAGEQLTYRYTNEEDSKTLRRYWTNACQACALKGQCTTGKERRISRWEHEAVEAVQARLDGMPHFIGEFWLIHRRRNQRAKIVGGATGIRTQGIAH
jgi:hypothetical protein